MFDTKNYLLVTEEFRLNNKDPDMPGLLLVFYLIVQRTPSEQMLMLKAFSLPATHPNGNSELCDVTYKGFIASNDIFYSSHI
ncbi:MAG TPA: hypothetical protein VKB95_09260 [Chitinophagaceae bacterium]|nr:hypothetical protein [Chitinophagaceae bacterium]